MTEPLTLLGSAAAGALIAGLVGWMNQRWRWRRDFEVRWDADRRRVYATFLTSSTIYNDATKELGLGQTGGRCRPGVTSRATPGGGAA
jgi:hypothetical protein